MLDILFSTFYTGLVLREKNWGGTGLFLVLIDVGGYIRSATPAAQDIRVLVDSHLMLSKHGNNACKSAFFSVGNIGRIGKYLARDKCFLLYLKLTLSFTETDGSLPGPLDFGMHNR